MIKIMFVCHGNICRSPMAEFIFKHLAEQEGRCNDFLVSSCATSTEEIGNNIYPPAANELRKHNVQYNSRRAVQLTKSDYDNYDMFIVMDENNIRNALRIFGSDPERKLSKLMDHTVYGGNVADPWYSGDFNTTYNDITNGCKALLNKL